jgi:type VI secretion system secreted protein VgrG
MRKIICMMAILSLYSLGSASAATITLGSAAGFAVLGGATVTNTGATTIYGDVGVYSGSAITGVGVVTLTGTLHASDAAAAAAQADARSAYDVIAGLTPVTFLTGNLGARTLTAGVYEYSSSAQMTGALTLSGPGQFVFLIGSELITATGSSVVLIGGANAADVFWDVGSSATLGGATAFKGSILAQQSVTLDAGATILDGRAIALNGAVTLIGNTIAVPPVPETSTWAMMFLGLAGLGFARYRASRKPVPILA